MDILNLIFQSFWFILPAYFANMSPVAFAPSYAKYNKPIDFGKTWDGKQILGPGKTWLGLIFGTLAGGVVGYLQSLTSIEPMMTWQIGLYLGFGALFGDSVGSLIKRRIGIKRGAKAPGLDQLDLIFGAFFIAWLVGIFNWQYFVVAVILTPLLHFKANYLAYLLKLKKVPW